MAERAYPEDPAYVNKTKYYYALIDRYSYGNRFTGGKVVLDVPCGSGWGGSFIDNAKSMYGIDVSYEALRYSKERFHGRNICGTMTILPFRDDAFEVALCFEGIEHITREEGVLFLNELKRVVNPDGMIVGSVPILDSRGRGTGNPFHKYEYPDSYFRLLLEVNFEIIEYTAKQGGDGLIVYFALRNKSKRTMVLIPSIFRTKRKLIEFVTRSAEDCEAVYLLCDKNYGKFEQDSDLSRISNLKLISWQPARTWKCCMGKYLRIADMLRAIKNRLLSGA